MKPNRRFTTLVTGERARRDNYLTLASCVVPRPIAFVSTISTGGVLNLAPFSFFNAVGASPPAIMFAPATKRDGSDKDTLANIRAVGEFVVNVVPHNIREQMNLASGDFAADVDEFEIAGLTPLPSRLVRPPRVAESSVHMECKLLKVVPIGEGPGSTNVCFGEIVCFHIDDEVLLPDETVDIERIDLIGRLGGDEYSTIRDRFTLPRPRPE